MRKLVRLKRFFNLRNSLITLAVILIVGGTALALNRKSSTDTATTGTSSGSTANTSQPTQANQSIAKPDSTSSDQPSTPAPSTTPGQKASVTPVISSWGQNQQTSDVEVSGFVSGIYESGTCTATLTLNGKQVTGSRTATPDAQSSSCGLITIARSKLSAGNWSITIKYESSKYLGTSKAVTLEVK